MKGFVCLGLSSGSQSLRIEKLSIMGPSSPLTPRFLIPFKRSYTPVPDSTLVRRVDESAGGIFPVFWTRAKQQGPGTKFIIPIFYKAVETCWLAQRPRNPWIPFSTFQVPRFEALSTSSPSLPFKTRKLRIKTRHDRLSGLSFQIWNKKFSSNSQTTPNPFFKLTLMGPFNLNQNFLAHFQGHHQKIKSEP